MNRKQRFDSWFRGWLPKEPILSTHQTSVDPKNSPIVRWTARTFVAASVAYVVLLIVGDLAGLTEGAGAYIWPIAVFGITMAPVGAVPFLVKRKQEQQRRTET